MTEVISQCVVWPGRNSISVNSEFTMIFFRAVKYKRKNSDGLLDRQPVTIEKIQKSNLGVFFMFVV